MEQNDRRRPRTKRLLSAELRTAGNAPRKVVVRDISPTGLMGDMGASPPAGEDVEVKLGALGWVAGKVVWNREGKFAVQFVGEIDPAAIKTVTIDAQPYMPPTNKRPV